MPVLANGLNLTRKLPSIANRPPPAKRKTIFDEDSNSEDEGKTDKTEAISSLGGLSEPSPASSLPKPSSCITSQPPSKPPKKAPVSQYGDLSAAHSSNVRASAAQSVDPTIYDYDGVYDSLHASKKASAAAAVGASPAGPKYMGNLLAAAEVRKRDQLRAKEKMLLKEREAEGDEFAGKEKFVTAAYKAQQEEMRRAEEAEAQREKEEAERKRRQGGGMVGLYKQMLERDEQKHEAAVKAVADGLSDKAKDGEQTNAPDEKENKSEAELAKEKGAVLNEEGQVVDKRQLLRAGLNVAPKPVVKSTGKDQHSASPASRMGVSIGGIPARVGDKQGMRDRQTRMLETQLLEASKRAAEDEDGKTDAIQRATKSRKTDGELEGAKERYLRRKREAEEAKKRGEAM